MIKVHVDVSASRRMLIVASKQARFAAAVALTKTAVSVKKELSARMPSELDRPKTGTVRAIRVEKADKNTLTAVVRYNRRGEGVPSEEFLAHNVHGGLRRDKRSEIMLRASGLLPEGMQTIPGAAAKLDGFGNMSRGQIVSILSFFRTFGVARWGEDRSGRGGGRKGDLLNSARMNRAARSRSAAKYFVVMPGDRRMSAGIWQRTDKQAKPVLMFVKRGRYPSRIKMFATGQMVIRRDFNRHFDAAYRQALATAR
jgi:hypothetical protein